MSAPLQIRKGTSTSCDARVAAQELFDAIHQQDIAFALFHCSNEYDLDQLGEALASLFGEIPLIGCTTSGEITPDGYLRGSITGVSVASEDFQVVSRRIDRLSDFEVRRGERMASGLLDEMRRHGREPSGKNSFAFLLIDGLSMQEESVVSSLYRGLGDINLFGGSAGDGEDFGATHVFHEGRFHSDAAILSVATTDHPFEVFKTQHFVPSDKKLVVTEADPVRRIVTEINGVPAGREYARMVGLEMEKLTPMIFATHPVVVKVGGNYYVRSIQKVNDDESLTFFCGIDEGIVLTVAQGVDLVENLEQAFEEVRAKVGTPELVIGCDCILRHLEVDRRGIKEDVARLMAANNVVGFSTYGEQFNAMHVNQTFTGVAIGGSRTGTDG